MQFSLGHVKCWYGANFDGDIIQPNSPTLTSTTPSPGFTRSQPHVDQQHEQVRSRKSFSCYQPQADMAMAACGVPVRPKETEAASHLTSFCRCRAVENAPKSGAWCSWHGGIKCLPLHSCWLIIPLMTKPAEVVVLATVRGGNAGTRFSLPVLAVCRVAFSLLRPLLPLPWQRPKRRQQEQQLQQQAGTREQRQD